MLPATLCTVLRPELTGAHATPGNTKMVDDTIAAIVTFIARSMIRSPVSGGRQLSFERAAPRSVEESRDTLVVANERRQPGRSSRRHASTQRRHRALSRRARFEIG